MRIGFVGWRGMVGSVLLQRMLAEQDFQGLEPTFFSTSSPGGPGPDVGHGATVLADATNLEALGRLPVIVSCQGGDYTKSVYPALRSSGWSGIWVDAASALRLDADAMIVLDPVNGTEIRDALHAGTRTFVGANCTVSLLLMGLIGLIRTGHVQWISTMTYQAASGAGARQMAELVAQMRHIGSTSDPNAAALELDRQVADALLSPSFPTAALGVPLAGSALPWIDRLVEGGQTREEWKAQVEANKLLARDTVLPIDGVCVRIGAMRCHAQAVTIKLDRPMSPAEVAEHIRGAHPWVEVVPNTPEDTLARLTPAATAGSLTVPIGRLRPMTLGPDFYTAFTVGDQLLWGAAEPLRRFLRILRES